LHFAVDAREVPVHLQDVLDLLQLALLLLNLFRLLTAGVDLVQQHAGHVQNLLQLLRTLQLDMFGLEAVVFTENFKKSRMTNLEKGKLK
jgi:hypothetical protein